MKKTHTDNEYGEQSFEPSRRSTISEVFDMPQGVFSNDFSQIVISGNREAIVEGCAGVLEYENVRIRLSLGRQLVQFTGRGLQIKCMTGNSVVIKGFILGVEFIN